MLHYFGTRYASTLVVLQILMVHPATRPATTGLGNASAVPAIKTLRLELNVEARWQSAAAPQPFLRNHAAVQAGMSDCLDLLSKEHVSTLSTGQ